MNLEEETTTTADRDLTVTGPGSHCTPFEGPAEGEGAAFSQPNQGGPLCGPDQETSTSVGKEISPPAHAHQAGYDGEVRGETTQTQPSQE